MVIWIDGTYGVGKTAVTKKVKELLTNIDVVILESDVYVDEFLKETIAEAKKHNILPDLVGKLPQNDMEFLSKFQKIITEKAKDIDKIILIDMALTNNLCKEKLLEVLINDGMKITHIILEADENIVKERIRKDDSRDKKLALDELKNNMDFLSQNYIGAIRIKTDNKSIEEVAMKIIHIIK